MKVSDAAAEFGSKSKLAKRLGVHPALITRWKHKVPEVWARRLHDITAGKLVFDLENYPIPKRTRRRSK